MAKPKYSLETRLAVVNHYLSGKDGAKRTADFFGIEGTSVRRWIRAWQLHSIDGITWKNDSHSPEFRETVVRATICEELTMREAAARFNISNESVVRHWVNVYKASGQKGLLLRAELRYLRAENAYLKKLKALVQHEKNGRKPE